MGYMPALAQVSLGLALFRFGDFCGIPQKRPRLVIPCGASKLLGWVADLETKNVC